MKNKSMSLDIAADINSSKLSQRKISILVFALFMNIFLAIICELTFHIAEQVFLQRQAIFNQLFFYSEKLNQELQNHLNLSANKAIPILLKQLDQYSVLGIQVPASLFKDEKNELVKKWNVLNSSLKNQAHLVNAVSAPQLANPMTKHLSEHLSILSDHYQARSLTQQNVITSHTLLGLQAIDRTFLQADIPQAKEKIQRLHLFLNDTLNQLDTNQKKQDAAFMEAAALFLEYEKLSNQVVPQGTRTQFEDLINNNKIFQKTIFEQKNQYPHENAFGLLALAIIFAVLALFTLSYLIVCFFKNARFTKLLVQQYTQLNLDNTLFKSAEQELQNKNSQQQKIFENLSRQLVPLEQGHFVSTITAEEGSEKIVASLNKIMSSVRSSLQKINDTTDPLLHNVEQIKIANEYLIQSLQQQNTLTTVEQHQLNVLSQTMQDLQKNTHELNEIIQQFSQSQKEMNQFASTEGYSLAFAQESFRELLNYARTYTQMLDWLRDIPAQMTPLVNHLEQKMAELDNADHELLKVTQALRHVVEYATQTIAQAQAQLSADNLAKIDLHMIEKWNQQTIEKNIPNAFPEEKIQHFFDLNSSIQESIQKNTDTLEKLKSDIQSRLKISQENKAKIQQNLVASNTAQQLIKTLKKSINL